MKAASVFLAIAAMVSAAAVPQSSIKTGNFNVTDFSASGSRFSLYEFYHLDVTDGKTNSACSFSTSIGPLPSITSFGYTPCANPEWSFGLFYINRTNPEPGYSLQITHRLHPHKKNSFNETGCIFIPQSDVKTTNDSNPNANYQYIDYTPNFAMQWTSGLCIYN